MEVGEAKKFLPWGVQWPEERGKRGGGGENLSFPPLPRPLLLKSNIAAWRKIVSLPKYQLTLPDKASSYDGSSMQTEIILVCCDMMLLPTYLS